jgi:hypothetical protein
MKDLSLQIFDINWGTSTEVVLPNKNIVIIVAGL